MTSANGIRILAAVAAVMLVAAACTSVGSGEATVTEGGSIRVGGVEVSIPPGALEADGQIRIDSPEQLASAPRTDLIARSSVVLGGPVDVSMFGSQLGSGAAAVSFLVDPSSVTDPGAVFVARFDQNRDRWIPLRSFYDPASGKVVGETDHLSLFGAFELVPERLSVFLAEMIQSVVAGVHDVPVNCPSLVPELYVVEGDPAREAGVSMNACVQPASTGPDGTVLIAEVRLRNRRAYPVVVSVPTYPAPVLMARNTGEGLAFSSIQDGVLANVRNWGELVAPDRIVAFPGEELVFELPIHSQIDAYSFDVEGAPQFIAFQIIMETALFLESSSEGLVALISEANELAGCLDDVFVDQGWRFDLLADAVRSCAGIVLTGLLGAAVVAVLGAVLTAAGLLTGTVEFLADLFGTGGNSAHLGDYTVVYQRPDEPDLEANLSEPVPGENLAQPEPPPPQPKPAPPVFPLPIPETFPQPAPPPADDPPQVAMAACYGRACVTAEGLLELPDTDGDIEFDAEGSSDPEGPITYSWFINDQLVSLQKEFLFPASVLVEGDNHVRLVVADGVPQRRSAGITINAPTVEAVTEPECVTDGLIIAGENGIVVTEACSVRSLVIGRPVTVALDDYAGGIIFQYEAVEVMSGRGPVPHQPIYWWPADAAEPEVLVDEGEEEWGTFVLHDTGVIDGNPIVLYSSVFQEIDPGYGWSQATIRNVVIDLETGERTVLTEGWTEDPPDGSIVTRMAFAADAAYDYVISPLRNVYAPCGDEFGIWDYEFEFYDSTGSTVSVLNAPTIPCDKAWLAHGVPSASGDTFVYAEGHPPGPDVTVHVTELSTGRDIGPTPVVPDVGRIASRDDRFVISSAGGWPQVYRVGELGVDLGPVPGIADFVRSSGGIQVAGAFQAPTAPTAAFPWLITPVSVGPITFGERISDLEDVTGMRWDLTEPAAPGCVLGSRVDGGISVQGSGTISKVVVTERGIAATAEGVQVGDPASFVLETYGDRASMEEGEYSGQIILVDGPRSRIYSYLFALDADEIVTEIYIASGPGLFEWGCT